MDAKPKRKWIALAGEKEKEENKANKPDVENFRPLFFKDWFNERTLSDFVIHTSKDSDARKYYCHKFIISCSCPKFYEKLMETKFECASEPERDHVLLVDPLKDKDEKMVTSFFQVLYNSSLMKDEAIKPQLDFLAEVYEKFDVKDLAASINEKSGRMGSAFAPHIEKFVPKLGLDTPISDMMLYFNKEKSIFLKVHRIMIANSSSYFKGLFTSGMKDSDTHESTITLEGPHKPEEIAAVMEDIMQFLYASKKFTLFSLMDYKSERVVAMNTLAHKYFFEEIRGNTEYYLQSYPNMSLIEPALKYDNQPALMSATKALIEVILSIDLTTLPVDYLNMVRYTDNQNLFHAIVENEFQPGSEPRLRQILALQERLGAAAQIKITDLDDNNNSCLHYACRDPKNNQDLIKYLMGKKLDVNAVNKDKEQPLGIALQSWVKTCYESAENRARERTKRREEFAMFSEEEDFDGKNEKHKQLVFNSVDDLIMAGAQVDLTKDENWKNFLCFSSSYDNNRSKECWTKITEMLMTSPKERFYRSLEREYINLFLQEKFEYPIKFFFDTLGILYKTKAQKFDDDNGEEVTLEARDLDNICIAGKNCKLKGMKVVVEGTEYYNRRNFLIKSNNSFTVKIGTKKYKFKYTGEAASFVIGLVSAVNGSKTVTYNYSKHR